MSVRLGLDKLNEAVAHPRLDGVKILRAYADCDLPPEIHLRPDDWQDIFPTNPLHHFANGWVHYETAIDGVNYTSCRELSPEDMARAIGALQSDPHSPGSVQAAAAALVEDDAWEGE